MEAISDFPARAMPFRPASGVCRRSWPQLALVEVLLEAQSRPRGRLSGECRFKFCSTTLRDKLLKIGARDRAPRRYVVFQLAEVAVPRVLFEKILRRIHRLQPRSSPLQA